MRLKYLAIALLFFSGISHSDELKDGDAALKLADQIMKQASSGNPRAAFDLAKPYVVIPQSELEAMLGQVELQAPMLATRFGKSTGYELLRNDTVGDSLIQAVYLQKFEKHAMVWRFIFYKNAKGWVLNSFKYDDNIASAF